MFRDPNSTPTVISCFSLNLLVVNYNKSELLPTPYFSNLLLNIN